jgi:Tfp pilus assembly protein PilO
MKKDSMIVFFVLFCTLLLAVLYLAPLIQEDNEMELNVEQQEKIHQQSVQDLQRAKNLKEEYDGMTEVDKARFATRIPDTLDQQSIIDEISMIAKQQGVLLSAVSFSKTTGNDVPKKVAILTSFSSVGDNNPIIALLRSIENGNRLFTMKNISLNFGNTRNDYTFTLESYYKQ